MQNTPNTVQNLGSTGEEYDQSNCMKPRFYISPHSSFNRGEGNTLRKLKIGIKLTVRNTLSRTKMKIASCN
jgi:hypothetical protein